jgi:hypothetical protein
VISQLQLAKVAPPREGKVRMALRRNEEAAAIEAAEQSLPANSIIIIQSVPLAVLGSSVRARLKRAMGAFIFVAVVSAG